jgi:hypothetical protein
VLWLLAIASAGAASPEAAPYADGAAPGFTGGFKEQACDACHFEAGINVKPGQLTISGVPERYAAGERYELIVTLTRPEMKIAGFQLAARLETTGAQAGTLAAGPADAARIKVETSDAVQYANQRKAGTALTAPGTARWTLVWTAPPASGPVVFHASANAANNDEFAGGDYVYTAVARAQAVVTNASDAARSNRAPMPAGRPGVASTSTRRSRLRVTPADGSRGPLPRILAPPARCETSCRTFPTP